MPRWLQAVCAGLILLGAGYVYMNLPFVTKRMRVTLEFIVDGKPVTGSGVVEASISKRAEWISFSTGSLTWKGEAIAIDLPGRGTVFAVMGFHRPLENGGTKQGGYPAEMLLSAFNIRGGPSGLSQTDINAIWRLSGSAEVPKKDWPNLIVFGNIEDPSSAIALDPERIGPALGPSVELKRVLVAITSDGITRTIEGRLPWLTQFDNARPYISGPRRGSTGMDLLYTHFWRK